MGQFSVNEANIAGDVVYGIKDQSGERVATHYTMEGVRRDLEELEYEARRSQNSKDMDDLSKIKNQIAETVFAKSLAEFEAMESDKKLKEIADKRIGIIKGCHLSNDEMDALLNECAEREGAKRLSGAFLETPEETRERLSKELTGKISACDFSKMSDEEKEESPLFALNELINESEKEKEDEIALGDDKDTYELGEIL